MKNSKWFKTQGVFILLGTLLLALTACGQPTASPSAPNEPADVSCTISILCQSALESEALPEDVRALLPENGILLEETKVSVPSGTTAFALLEQEAKANNLALDVSKSGTVYVKGIGNLYEKSCGDMSGWLYWINGEMAMTGASDYVLKEGDNVEWIFSSDMEKAFS